MKSRANDGDRGLNNAFEERFLASLIDLDSLLFEKTRIFFMKRYEKNRYLTVFLNFYMRDYS